MTVAALDRERTFSQHVSAFVAIAAGCVALAARPRIAGIEFGITVAVGLAGAVGLVARERRTSTLSTGAVTAAAIAAFAVIRSAAVLPRGPATPRFALLLVGVAIAEEIFFRRYLYGVLAERGAAVAITVSALAFALVHLPEYGASAFPIDLAAGFVLSWQRWATGSWVSSAASHAAANLMAIL